MKMFEAEFRRIVREEIRAAIREELEAIRTPAGSEGPEPITLAEAAAFARHKSAATVKRWIAEGRLSKYGSGRNVTVDRKELVRLLASMGREEREPGATLSDAEADARAAELLGRDH
jgi:hypothetical protein